jgi:CRISPR-associated exonuclease Cas4
MNLLHLALLLLLLALLAGLFSFLQRRRSGLPAGRLIYTDTRAWQKPAKNLFDPHLALVGRPDYLVRHGDMLIPVEVKSGQPPASPYQGHILQLAAYCLLAWRACGTRPSHGILHYPGCDFSIPFTPRLEARLLALLERLRQADSLPEVERSHQDPSRCRACGFAHLCDQKVG